MNEKKSISEQLIDFPCEFTFKAVMQNQKDASLVVYEIINQYAKADKDSIETRSSSNLKYISISCTSSLDNAQQLELIYKKLKEHPNVVMTL